jgi:hypothetical protein
VKVSSVPQIEGLSCHEFMDYIKKKPSIVKYFPDEKDWIHLDRHWICDVLYTIDTENFQEMINKALRSRKEKLEENQNLNVQMRPEFIAALE